MWLRIFISIVFILPAIYIAIKPKNRKNPFIDRILMIIGFIIALLPWIFPNTGTETINNNRPTQLAEEPLIASTTTMLVIETTTQILATDDNILPSSLINTNENERIIHDEVIPEGNTSVSSLIYNNDDIFDELLVFDNYADDQFSNEQGKNGWKYVLFETDAIVPNENITLLYHEEHYNKDTNIIDIMPCWHIGSDDSDDYDFGFIRSDAMQPGRFYDVAKEYTIPKTGIAIIGAKHSLFIDHNAEIDKGTDGEVIITVYLNTVKLDEKTIYLDNDTPFGILMDVIVNQGDKIYFRVNKSLNANSDYLHWIPGISIN